MNDRWAFLVNYPVESCCDFIRISSLSNDGSEISMIIIYCSVNIRKLMKSNILIKKYVDKNILCIHKNLICMDFKRYKITFRAIDSVTKSSLAGSNREHGKTSFICRVADFICDVMARRVPDITTTENISLVRPVCLSAKWQ